MDTLNVDGRSTDREGGQLVYERSHAPDRASGDYVEFIAAGQQVKGEYHCAECGYGVIVFKELPRCPMCGNASWEQSAWSPFARARNVLQ
jgi:hypothetical protein